MNFEIIPQLRMERKSNEKLQAQSEIFTDSGVEIFSDNQIELLKYSSELAKIKDLNNLPNDLPQELVDLINKNKEVYIDFLRKEKKLETAFIEENIKKYREKFQVVIAKLKAKMVPGIEKELPEYLGSGSNGSVFVIEVDGKKYAAKFSISLTQSNFEIKPLLRAKGIPHTAQLEAYSFEDGVVIMNLLPGRDVSSFTKEDAPEYSDKDIIELIETVKKLYNVGIVIDPKASNFMYDKEGGFSILDFHLNNNINEYGLADAVMSLRIALTARKFERLDYNALDYEEKVRLQSIEKNKVFLPTMVRFISILQEKYPEILLGWRKKYYEDKKNPRISRSEMIQREYIPEHPDFEPYLKRLEEMGF